MQVNESQREESWFKAAALTCQNCCNRIASLFPTVPPEQEVSQFKKGWRKFTCATVIYTAGFALTAVYHFVHKRDVDSYHLASYIVKGVASAIFLNSAWDLRKVEQRPAQSFAFAALITTIGAVGLEVSSANWTRYDHDSDRIIHATMDIFFGFCILANSSYSCFTNRHNLDYQSI